MWSAEKRETVQLEGWPMHRPRAVMATRLDEAVPVLVAKDSKHESEAWRRAVASLPCQLCGKEGETQCAHRNEGGKGMGYKNDDVWSAGLCVTCHSEIDQGRDLSREERRARLDKAILLTVRELARRGILIVRTK
jgi:hypothetical protein